MTYFYMTLAEKRISAAAAAAVLFFLAIVVFAAADGPQKPWGLLPLLMGCAAVYYYYRKRKRSKFLRAGLTKDVRDKDGVFFMAEAQRAIATYKRFHGEDPLDGLSTQARKDWLYDAVYDRDFTYRKSRDWER